MISNTVILLGIKVGWFLFLYTKNVNKQTIFSVDTINSNRASLEVSLCGHLKWKYSCASFITGHNWGDHFFPCWHIPWSYKFIDYDYHVSHLFIIIFCYWTNIHWIFVWKSNLSSFLKLLALHIGLESPENCFQITFIL